MEDNTLLNKFIDYLLDNPSSFLNFQKVQRVLGINETKINQLFEYLEDQKIGKRIYPYPLEHDGLELVPYCKFYFADYQKYFENKQFRPDQQGALLEQYFYSCLSSINQFEIYTFRTNNNIEIDFIAKQISNGKLLAIEIKKDQFIYAGDLGHLHSFNKLNLGPTELWVLHNGIRDNFEGVVHICPIDKFIAQLKTT